MIHVAVPVRTSNTKTNERKFQFALRPAEIRLSTWDALFSHSSAQSLGYCLECAWKKLTSQALIDIIDG